MNQIEFLKSLPGHTLTEYTYEDQKVLLKAIIKYSQYLEKVNPENTEIQTLHQWEVKVSESMAIVRAEESEQLEALKKENLQLGQQYSQVVVRAVDLVQDVNGEQPR